MTGCSARCATSGIDFGLTIAAQLDGETTARTIRLAVEYDPDPPFAGGHPTREAPEIGDALKTRLAGIAEARWSIAEKAAARLR